MDADRRSRAEATRDAAEPVSQRPSPTGQTPAAARPLSQKRLRDLLRTSPLVTPELRVHWLRVLPHLSEAQRGELAALLGAPPPAAPPHGAT